MEIENRMVIGDYYNEAPEISPSELSEQFREWIELECIFEDSEIFNFWVDENENAVDLALGNTEKQENARLDFLKYRAKYLASEFNAEKEEELSTTQAEEILKKHF